MQVPQSTPATSAIYSMAWPLAMNAMLLHSSLIIDTMLITPLGEDEIRVDGWLKPTLALTIGNHFKLAIPIAGTFISMTMAKNVCMLLYAKMSIVNFAAMTLILPWMQFLVFIMMAWAQATGIFVGQLLGKNVSGNALDEFIGRAWRVAFFLAALVSLAYFIMSLVLGWIYADLQAETLSALWSFMPVLLIITFPKVSNSICGNVLRAGGDAVHVMKIHMATQWFVWVPLTAVAILYLKLPVNWVFAIFLIDEIVKILPFHRRMLGGKWKRNLAIQNIA